MAATLFVLLLFVGLFSAFEDSFLDEEFLEAFDPQREYVKMLETSDEDEEFLSLMETSDQDEEFLSLMEASDQDEEDLSLSIIKDKGVCWKNTYGRGVGKIPSGCDRGYQKHGLLCYKDCPSGYKTATGKIDPYCYKRCKSGYKDHGLTCYKHFFKWYWKKNKIGRIRGMTCGSGMEKDAGLCYKRCSSGTHGVGPVCWGKCVGDKPVNGGAICCKDRGTCNKKIMSLTGGVLKTVLKGVSGSYAQAGVEGAKAVLGYIMPICGK